MKTLVSTARKSRRPCIVGESVLVCNERRAADDLGLSGNIASSSPKFLVLPS